MTKVYFQISEMLGKVFTPPMVLPLGDHVHCEADHISIFLPPF